MPRHPTRIVTAFALAALTGCTLSREEMLEQVAKDWSLTIRASQVMPVYPLTQDLFPGDLFLVTLPIDRQQEVWQRKGFLPLDNHLDRLDVKGFGAFYDHSFLPGGVVPKDFPSELLNLGQGGAGAWAAAPRAAFPTYSFSVQRGRSLDLAVPISGVPVGLGLLGADAAEGTVAIGKARTLGVDLVTLYAQLRDWAHRNAGFLAAYRSAPAARRYLRVVARVYLTGELDVVLRRSESQGAGLDVGVLGAAAAGTTALAGLPKDANYAEQLQKVTAAALENHGKLLDGVNTLLKSLDAGKPGGSLRLTSASSSVVSLHETFDPPLVLGYVGFDCEIEAGGELGPPLPTLAVLQNQFHGLQDLGQSPGGALVRDRLQLDVYKALLVAAPANERARAAVTGLQDLWQHVPPQATFYDELEDGSLVRKPWTRPETGDRYEVFRAWWSNLRLTARRLTDAVAKPTIVDGKQVAPGSAENAALVEALRATRFQLDNPAIVQEHALASNAAFAAFVDYATRED